MNNDPSQIRIEGLKKKYGEVQALSSISLKADHGLITGLIGPDGAGKTTLLKILLSLEKKDSGFVRCLDADPEIKPERIRQNVGYMPEVFSLYPDLSVEENLLFSYRIHKGNKEDFKAKRDRLYLFNRLSRFSGTRAGNLSGGMKQKLALSCSLMHDPELLVLDEPTTGVDPLSRREFWGMLKELKKQGLTIIVSTPYMDEAYLCDQIYLMHKGQVLLSGSPEEVIKNFSGSVVEITFELDKPQIHMDTLSRLFPDGSVYLFGKSLHLFFDEKRSQGDIEKVLYDSLLHCSVQNVKPDLEDLFVISVLRGEYYG